MTSVYALPAGPLALAVPAPRPTPRDVLTGVVLALHAPDERWAWAHGLTVTRAGSARVYRSPLFDARTIEGGAR